MTDASGPSAPSPMKQRGGGTALAAVTAGAAGLLAVYDSAWAIGIGTATALFVAIRESRRPR
ncbi:hypothetical protein [Catenuloplanes japonicus]|uniref:hypothetical protein n=1 Tax=Catenuloplanes japonicus TaxID=33876 RepID=UPI0012FB653A|nr:hypothetical protein [Catenuloplanes japonicus]